MVSHISSFENNSYNTFLRSTSTTMTTTSTNTFRDNETTKKKIDTLLDDIINEDNERIANDDHLLFESSNRSFTLTQLHDSSGSFHHHRSKKQQQPPQPTRRSGWNGSCRSFVASSSDNGEISNSSNGSEMLLIDDTSIPSILPPHARKSDTRRLLTLGNTSTSTLPQIHETTKLSKCRHHHDELDTSLLGLLKNSGNETLEMTTDLMNPKRINKAVSLRQHAVYSRTKSNESIPNDTTPSASSNQRTRASSKFGNNTNNTLTNNLSGSLASSSTAVTSTADLERCDSSRFRHSFTSSTSNHHNNIPKHHNDRLHHSMSALKVVPTTTTKGSTISSSHNNGCEHPDYATNKKITSLNMFLKHSSNRPGKKNTTTIKHSFPLDVSDRCSVSSISYTSYDDSEDVSASSIYDDHPETIHEVSTTSLSYSFLSPGQQYRTNKNKLLPSASSVSGGLHRSVSCLSSSRCLSPIRTGGVHRSVPTTTTTTTTMTSSTPSSSSPSSAERNLLRRGSYDSAPKLPNRFRSPARSIATTATDDSKK